MHLKPISLLSFFVFTFLLLPKPSNAFFTELFTKIKDKLMGDGDRDNSQNVNELLNGGGYSSQQGFANQLGGYGGGYQQQYGQMGQQFGIREQKYEHYGQQGGVGGQFGGEVAQQQQSPQLIGSDPNGPNPYAQNPFGQFNGEGEKEEKGIFSRMASWIKNKAVDLISKGKLFSSSSSSTSNNGDDK